MSAYRQLPQSRFPRWQSQVPSFSPEYLECRELWIKHWGFTLEDTSDASDAFWAEYMAAIDAYWAAKERLMNRPVRTWQDVVEIAHTSSWEQGHFVVKMRDDEHWAPLLKAIEAMSGSWDVPPALAAAAAASVERARRELAERERLEALDSETASAYSMES